MIVNTYVEASSHTAPESGDKATMSTTINSYTTRPVPVEAGQYDGTTDSLNKIIDWVEKRGGTIFPAAELSWRHDYGTYFHHRHGHVYLPQGGKRVGGQLVPLEDDELVVLTNTRTFALVFPGDYVVRSSSGFYPQSAESFHPAHAFDSRRRGSHQLTSSPTV